MGAVASGAAGMGITTSASAASRGAASAAIDPAIRLCSAKTAAERSTATRTRRATRATSHFSRILAAKANAVRRTSPGATTANAPMARAVLALALSRASKVRVENAAGIATSLRA